MRVTVSLPQALIEAVERERRRHRVSRSKFIADAVAGHLATRHQDVIRQKLDAVYATEVAVVPEGLDLAQRRMLQGMSGS